jgi:hypothetical protein
MGLTVANSPGAGANIASDRDFRVMRTMVDETTAGQADARFRQGAPGYQVPTSRPKPALTAPRPLDRSDRHPFHQLSGMTSASAVRSVPVVSGF